MEDKRQLAKEKRLKKKKRNKYTAIILLFTVIIIFVFLYVKFSVSATTKVIYYGTAEKTFPAKGIAVFEEELISSPSKGIAIINYSDGTRVLAKTHIATIYSGDIDESKSNEIRQLSEKINYLETNMKNRYDKGKNAQSAESVINEKMKKISEYSLNGNLESVLSEASELKGIISSNSEANPETQLEELKAKRTEAERSITGKKEEYISKNAGAVFSSVDGYETIINTQTTKDADINVFQSLWNSKPVDYQKSNDNYVYGKIINNYEIKVLSLADAKDVEDLKEGSTIHIRLKSQRNENIPAIVEKISVNSKKALITLRVTKDIEYFLNERKFEFEFIKASYDGLRVPKEAIISENNETFVYVIKDGIVRKRKIDILYDSGDVIVKEDNSNSEGLLLYDLVIVKSKNISEGMVIGY